jgi:hypothetical protein
VSAERVIRWAEPDAHRANPAINMYIRIVMSRKNMYDHIDGVEGKNGFQIYI